MSERKSRVALVSTSAERVLQDYQRVMRIAGMFEHLPKEEEILLKLNLSWVLYFPASNTEPWQLEGVIRALVEEGYSAKRLLAVENRTVVTKVRKGAEKNLWMGIFRKYGVRFLPLDEAKWVAYQPKGSLEVLPRLFGGKLEIPEVFVGKWVVHLPTLKTHGHTITTGAVKNSFGGLLKEYRHYGHKYIHETLVDLMRLQKEVHPGIGAVVDGTVAGDGAGPRCLIPREKNILLAGWDTVAVDAIGAKLMGFAPLEIPYLAGCERAGLGVANPEGIELVGDVERGEESWGFQVKRSLVIRTDQVIRRGMLRPLEKILLHSPLMGWAPLASFLYHDFFWYPLIGRRHLKKFFFTQWGKLWREYERNEVFSPRSESESGYPG